MLARAYRPASRFRVAILCDFAQERWPSMDLVGDMLTRTLQHHHRAALQAVRVQPRFRRRLGRIHASRLTESADRLLNRMLDYPRHLRALVNDFDLFHVIDHSYSHLVLELPPGRAAVTCHDLFTFRCLLQPEAEPRSATFRLMTNRILTGLRQARGVACVSEATRGELLHHRLVNPTHIRVIANGVSPVYSPAPDRGGDGDAARLLGPNSEVTELLNVGSTAPRKRINLLLRVLAALRDKHPSLRLIRVGGGLTREQAELARALGVKQAIVELPFVPSRTLAAIYRRAAAVLCPSEAEGFGLPLLESMACGTPVVASDIGASREVGAGVPHYVWGGDLHQWTTAVLDLLGEKGSREWTERRQAGLQRAKDFPWWKTAARTVALYRSLLS